MPTPFSYFICTNPRSGSKILCDLLGQYPCFSQPDEYFHPDNIFFKLFFQQKNNTYPNKSELEQYIQSLVLKTFGYKFMWETFDLLKKTLVIEDNEKYDQAIKLASFFSKIKYIWLTRENKVQQAISWAKAIESNLWYTSNREREVGPILEMHTIDSRYKELIRLDRQWHIFFLLNNIKPLQITYENFIETPDSSLRQIADFLEIALPEIKKITFPSIKLADQSSLLLEKEYRDNYLVD